MQDLWWHTDGWQWHGLQWGSGSSLLICFHGFGEDAFRFEVLEKALGNDFTIVAVDLPFHGSTRPVKETDMTPQPMLWGACIQRVLEQFHQPHFSLLGYSLGGRICLQLIQQIPHRIKQLILLAPDGLHHNCWFYFLTRTYVGQKLFRWHVDHPRMFFTITKWLQSLHLLAPSFKKFLELQMDTKAKRMQVWLSWNSLRYFIPDMKQVKKHLEQYQIPCYLFFGKYDRVIKPAYGKPFCKDLSRARMFVLDCGHQLLTAETALVIKQQLDLHS